MFCPYELNGLASCCGVNTARLYPLISSLVYIGAVTHQAQSAGTHQAQSAGTHQAQSAGTHQAQSVLSAHRTRMDHE